MTIDGAAWINAGINCRVGMTGMTSSIDDRADAANLTGRNGTGLGRGRRGNSDGAKFYEFETAVGCRPGSDERQTPAERR